MNNIKICKYIVAVRALPFTDILGSLKQHIIGHIMYSGIPAIQIFEHTVYMFKKNRKQSTKWK